jgi:hypothetical protein
MRLLGSILHVLATKVCGVKGEDASHMADTTKVDYYHLA